MAILQGTPINTQGVHPLAQLLGEGTRTLQAGFQANANTLARNNSITMNLIRAGMQDNMKREELALRERQAGRAEALRREEMAQRDAHHASSLASRERIAAMRGSGAGSGRGGGSGFTPEQIAEFSQGLSAFDASLESIFNPVTETGPADTGSVLPPLNDAPSAGPVPSDDFPLVNPAAPGGVDTPVFDSPAIPTPSVGGVPDDFGAIGSFDTQAGAPGRGLPQTKSSALDLDDLANAGGLVQEYDPRTQAGSERAGVVDSLSERYELASSGEVSLDDSARMGLGIERMKVDALRMERGLALQAGDVRKVAYLNTQMAYAAGNAAKILQASKEGPDSLKAAYSTLDGLGQIVNPLAGFPDVRPENASVSLKTSYEMLNRPMTEIRELVSSESLNNGTLGELSTNFDKLNTSLENQRRQVREFVQVKNPKMSPTEVRQLVDERFDALPEVKVVQERQKLFEEAYLARTKPDPAQSNASLNKQVWELEEKLVLKGAEQQQAAGEAANQMRTVAGPLVRGSLENLRSVLDDHGVELTFPKGDSLDKGNFSISKVAAQLRKAHFKNGDKHKGEQGYARAERALKAYEYWLIGSSEDGSGSMGSKLRDNFNISMALRGIPSGDQQKEILKTIEDSLALNEKAKALGKVTSLTESRLTDAEEMLQQRSLGPARPRKATKPVTKPPKATGPAPKSKASELKDAGFRSIIGG